jgi:hypothetical protein
MRTRALVLATLAAIVLALFVACGDDHDAASGGGSGSAEGTSAGGSASGDAPRGGTGERPAAAADLRVQLEMIDLVHLADVDHGGLYMDFGTAARPKYTMGAWRSGWGADGVDGDETYSYASETGRVYFDVRQGRAACRSS